MKNHQNRPEKQLRDRKIQYLRGLAASGKQEKRGNSSTQKRKNMKKQRKYKEMGVYCGRLQARERKSIKKDSEPIRSVQKSSKSTQNHENP